MSVSRPIQCAHPIVSVPVAYLKGEEVTEDLPVPSTDHGLSKQSASPPIIRMSCDTKAIVPGEGLGECSHPADTLEGYVIVDLVK